MSDFKINFNNPWLLLLLIPAFGLTLFTYFRLSKKYRKTRNRIVSIVLHSVVMVLCIAVLAGINFTYDLPNDSNEILLLVDVSGSGEKTQEDKDAFVKSVVDKIGGDYKVGIVTFGFDQVYAAELTYDSDGVYGSYLAADMPDVSATDIAAALSYARTLFENPKTAKIVLISDGLETDENAVSVIKSLAAEGIKVDTAYFAPGLGESEVQVSGVELPDYNVAVGDSFEVSVLLNSSYAGEASVTLFDNGEKGNTVSVQLVGGEQTVSVEHAFLLPGFHELRFEVDSGGDTLNENNVYYSYKYLEVFDRILIIDGNHREGETDLLEQLLGENEYNVSVVPIDDETLMPSTLNELREYDQVILMNVSNEDMPEGFVEILYSYVYDIGGGLFTVGGNTTDDYGEEVANVYNRSDMYGTQYQEMLPVQAINYTPPVAVVIIIDASGSMRVRDEALGKTAFEQAKDGAISCLNGLTERDYCGVMTLAGSFDTVSEILPVTQRYKIVEQIDELDQEGGGTSFAPAIERAGAALMAIGNVERRHIVIVSDGYPTDAAENYLYYTELNYEKSGITLSVIAVEPSNYSSTRESMVEEMTALTEAGHGRLHEVSDASTIPRIMREELNVPEIKEVNYEAFKPIINSYTAVVNGISQEDMPELSGYYGTKAKEGATVVLRGEYVPIYAQWKFGAGMVGSFMCDLNGTWSSEFLANSTGQRFLNNVIKGLLPTENIRSNEIDVVFVEDNYHTNISIYTDMEEEQRICVTITSPAEDGVSEPSVQTISPSVSEDYSRISFIVTRPGVHSVVVEKTDAEGNVLASYSDYRILSYSEEYDCFADEEQGEALLAQLAQSGKGMVLTDAWDVFENIEKFIHKTYDPIIPFLITALVLFLLDIAVRKFKFKWPHELIREHREAKRSGVKKSEA